MQLERAFSPDNRKVGAGTPSHERVTRTQENIAEQSRVTAERAPRALGSAQRIFTNKLKQVVEHDLSLRGQTMPENAQSLFDRGFRIKEGVPAEAETLKRTRQETVKAVRAALERGEITPKDISPSEAIPAIKIDGADIPYREVVTRIKETLAVTVREKKIHAVLKESGMSDEEAARAIGELATSIARTDSIDRFIGNDLLGIRSSEQPVHPKKKSDPRPQPRSSKGTLEDAFKQAGVVLPTKENLPQGNKKTSDEKREAAYLILSEMAKNSGLETPVRIGGKVRPVSFIITPRHERDENDQPVEGGDEWFIIKRAFHVLMTKDEKNPKRFEPTNLVKEGVPNEMTVRTPDDMPEAIMDGMREWGFPDDKEQAFLWMLEGGKAGAANWRERMKVTEAQAQATESK